MVNNADLNFDPTKVNAKYVPQLISTRQELSRSEQQEANDQQNGLMLFSTTGKMNTNSNSQVGVANGGEPMTNQCLDTLNNPENILSKLIEFRSNVTPNDLI